MQATAQAQPNIALVKYWGKRDQSRNLPAVPSLSITLDSLWTQTRVAFEPGLEADRFSLNGNAEPAHLARVNATLDRLRELAGCGHSAVVESVNNFPTNAGLASSASGFAALVTAGCAALGLEFGPGQRSRLARLASGSAARSIFGGFVEMPLDPHNDDLAMSLLEAAAWPLQVVVAVTSRAEKPTGSRAGMLQSAASADFYPAWVETTPRDFQQARAAVLGRDFSRLSEISEHSCLKMHAVMLSARPGLVYWNSATVDCLHRIRELRRRGNAVFFTVDAGPQVKAVCLPEHRDHTARALAEIPGVLEVISSGLGAGAQLLPAIP